MMKAEGTDGNAVSKSDGQPNEISERRPTTVEKLADFDGAPTNLSSTNANGDAELAPPLDTFLSDAYPEGGLRAWLVVFGSFCGMVACFGFMNSIGTFEAWLSTHQLADQNGSAIGWIFSIYLFLSFFCGLQVGPIFDAKGPRWLVAAGSVLLLAGVFAFAESKGEFAEIHSPIRSLFYLSVSCINSVQLTSQCRRFLRPCVVIAYRNAFSHAIIPRTPSSSPCSLAHNCCRSYCCHDGLPVSIHSCCQSSHCTVNITSIIVMTIVLTMACHLIVRQHTISSKTTPLIVVRSDAD